MVAASYSCELWELCCVSTAPAPIGAPAHIGATTTTICCTEDSTEVSADETFFFTGFQKSATSEKKYLATSSKLEAWCKFEAETTGRTTSTVVDAKSTAVGLRGRSEMEAEAIGSATTTKVDVKRKAVGLWRLWRWLKNNGTEAIGNTNHTKVDVRREAWAKAKVTRGKGQTSPAIEAKVP